ncbi:hypothetical protein NT95_06100 [Oenococcus kitaharae]|uniref:YhgE/Pip domain-containing protein n=1 Tax=Oenococcus kitaharae TaxID=336988 RepID=UPI00086310F7|nr:YhgE/Pip domain-containing protein [Oenococcus kitaharae]OEY82555.1 hypothetical protein NT95_06100 [Oenococcus kitaharae]
MIKKEFKFIRKNKLIFLSVVVMTLIPFLYSIFFLKSVWDPYGNTQNLPVAVVNEDHAVKYNKLTLNVGQSTVNKLRRNNQLGWKIVSKREAAKGLKKGKYYTVVTIPQNFSKNATTVLTTHPKKMVLHYETNDSQNYIARVISELGNMKLNEQIRAQVTNAYASAVFNQLHLVGSGMGKAASGASQLNNGLVTFQNGISQYTVGVSKVNDGMQTLKLSVSPLSAGVRQLASGSSKLTSGLQTYTSGVSQVAGGLSTLNAKTSQLSSGVAKLTAGSNKLTQGLQDGLQKAQKSNDPAAQTQIKELLAGLTSLNAGINQLNTQVHQNSSATTDIVHSLTSAGTQAAMIGQNLQAAQKELSSLTPVDADKAAAQMIAAANAGLNAEQEAKLKAVISASLSSQQGQTATVLTSVGGYLTNIATADQTIGNNLKEVRTSLDSIQTDLTNLQDGVKKLNDGANQALPGAKTAITTMQAGLGTVASSLTSAANGSATVTGGLTQLNRQVPTLTGAISQLSNGTEILRNGSSPLLSGSKQLSSGLTSLNDQLPALTSGINQLANGTGQLAAQSPVLSRGADKLTQGSETLANSLTSGAKTINGIKTTGAMTKMFAEPTSLKHKSYSYVPNYGSALAPYVLSVAIYVGAIVFNFAYPIRKVAERGKSATAWFLSKCSIGTVMAVAMAVIEATLIILIGGLHVDHLDKFYLTAILFSLASMFIVMFLSMLLDNPGRFIAMVLLMLQLGGSGGTFPMEITNSFYNAIHPYLPMSYSIYGFREAITSGFTTSFYNGSMLVLLLFLAGALVLLWLSMQWLQRHHLQGRSQLDQNQKLQEIEK